MLEEEVRNTSTVNENFAKVVIFNKDYMSLHDLIEETIDLYVDYWDEYLKSYLSINSLIE